MSRLFFKLFPGVGLFTVAIAVLCACEGTPLTRLNFVRQLGANAIQTIDVELKNNCQPSGSQRVDFMATSLSYAIRVQRLPGTTTDFFVMAPDTDGDSVSDADELLHRLDYCLDLRRIDTLPDNYGDWIIHLLRIPCEMQGALASADGTDTDGDGLKDGEERLYRTDPEKWDTDRDGIPDSLEVRFGTNALVPNNGSWSSDSMTDLEKVRRGLPVFRTLNPEIERYGYRYETSVDTEDPACNHDTISNIPIVPTIPSNQISFYRISNRGSRSVLERRQLRVPSDLKSGEKISIEWKDLEVGL